MIATETHRQTAANYVQRAMLAVASVDGDDALVEAPYFPGSLTTHIVPRPLAGIRAALLVEQHARAAARRDVRAAREAGHTWEEIGTALGLASRSLDITTSLGEAAHNWAVTGAADGNGPHRPTGYHRNAWGFTWRCPDCNGLVSDQGPIEGNPTDAEPGHTTDCTRLAAAITAHDDALATYDEED